MGHFDFREKALKCQTEYLPLKKTLNVSHTVWYIIIPACLNPPTSLQFCVKQESLNYTIFQEELSQEPA